MMRKYCSACAKNVETEIKQMTEEYVVKGQKFIIEARVRLCSECSELIWDDELDNQNMISAFNKYRKANGLLLPDEIKEIRQKYQLSQTSFAKILGLGEKTITRYENGSIQDSAQNNLIFLMRNISSFKLLWKKNKMLLQTIEIDKTEKALLEIDKENVLSWELITNYENTSGCVSFKYNNLQNGNGYLMNSCNVN